MSAKKSKENRSKLLDAHLTCIDDNPNKLAHLGVRSAYTLIAWGMLGVGISPGNAFFVSIFLFALPLLMDYLKFNPENAIRKNIRGFQIALSSFWVIIGLFGAFGIFEVVQGDSELVVRSAERFIALKSLDVPVELLWYCLGSATAITLVDWVACVTPAEVNLNESMKNNNITR